MWYMLNEIILSIIYACKLQYWNSSVVQTTTINLSGFANRCQQLPNNIIFESVLFKECIIPTTA